MSLNGPAPIHNASTRSPNGFCLCTLPSVCFWVQRPMFKPMPSTKLAQVCRSVFGKTRSTFESHHQRLRGVPEKTPSEERVASRSGTWNTGLRKVRALSLWCVIARGEGRIVRAFAGKPVSKDQHLVGCRRSVVVCLFCCSGAGGMNFDGPQSTCHLHKVRLEGEREWERKERKRTLIFNSRHS